MEDKKTRKMRGSRTHGYGAGKKHRGKGSKGGKGYAGSTKHRRSYIYKYEPEHFGHKGFYSLKSKSKTIGVGSLEKMAGGKSEIDLTSMGYDKLLSNGAISKPLVVKIGKFSKKAKEKVEAAGGQIKQ
jgi:large subunit ribosomal protein L15